MVSVPELPTEPGMVVGPIVSVAPVGVVDPPGGVVDPPGGVVDPPVGPMVVGPAVVCDEGVVEPPSHWNVTALNVVPASQVAWESQFPGPFTPQKLQLGAQAEQVVFAGEANVKRLSH